MTQLNEAPGLRTESNHDLRIMRSQKKRVQCQLACWHVLLLAEELADPLINVAEPHLGIALGEALFDDEPTAGNRDLPFKVDDHGGCTRIHSLDEDKLSGLEAFDTLLGAKLVGNVLHLFYRIPTHDFLLPALC